jgi:uncharacterized protein (DUF58 family)
MTQLTALTKHNQVTAIRILDTLELEPPAPGFYTISDGEAGQLSFSTNTKNQQSAYYDALHEHHDFVAKQLTTLGIPIIDCQTHEDIADKMALLMSP